MGPLGKSFARRWLVSAAALALAWSLPAGGGQPTPRDTWTGVERIVAVGDVHGDYGQLVKVLRAAAVVDANLNWAAGKTHLVQIGDVLDRAGESRKAMDLLRKLELQAAAAGGAVHALIGNHEAMVLLDDWRYVHPDEIKALGGEAEFRRAMSGEGTYGRWIRGHNTAVRINDVIFVHAGINRLWAGKSLTEINETIRLELRTGDPNGMGSSVSGPLWSRVLASNDEQEVGAELDVVLKKLRAARMVIGHSADTRGIVARAGGRLIRIDVGMSEYYGGPPACLVIDRGRYIEVRHGAARAAVASQPVGAR